MNYPLIYPSSMRQAARMASALALLVLVWLCIGIGALDATETTTYVLTDVQGTVIMTEDAHGVTTSQQDYRPYGKPNGNVGPDGPGYTGHVNDLDTGLVYMQQRYYDPEVGRFLSVDPVGPTPGDIFNLNRYSYGNLAPTIHIDPDGRVVEYDSKGAQKLVKETREKSALVDGEVKFLEHSTNTWKIKFAHLNGGKNGVQSHVTAESMKDAKSVSEGGTGKGTGGEVVINKWAERVKVASTPKGAAEIVKVDKGEALAHELTHALQNDSGTTSGDAFTREHSAREVEDNYRKEQGLEGARNNVEGN